MATALLRPGTAPLINPYAPIPESPQLDGTLGVGQAERGLRSAAFTNTAGEAATDYYKAQAAGDVPGAQAAGLRMQNYQQRAEKYAPRVQSVGDIHGVGDAADWAMGVAGQLPTTLVPAMAGGLVGGGLGGALFRGAGAALGGHLGAGAAMYPQMRDAARLKQSQAEQQGAPALPAQQVLTDTSNQGLIQANIEALVPGLASRSLLGQGAKVALTKPVGGALRRVGRDIALDSGAAGLSEKVATSFETGRNPGRDTSGDNMRYVDAMASEAMGGGVMGAAGHAGDVVHTALGTGARATGDAAAYAARLAEQGGAAGVDKAKELWANRPKTLDEAAVMAGEGAAKLHTGAEDAVTRVLQRGKDADIDEMLRPADATSEATLRATDAAKHKAATNLIARYQANPGAVPDYVQAAVAQYAQGARTGASWEPVADALKDMHRAQGIGTAFKSFVDEASLKLGEGAAKLMNAKDDAVDTYRVKREMAKRANAQTPDMMLDIEAARDDLSPLLDEALAPLTGLMSQAALDNTLPSLAHGMRAWVENSFSMRKNGEPVVPSSLLNMFTDPAKAVQATVDLLHRQGLVDDSILPLRDLVLRQLEVKKLAREEAAVIVDEMMLPTQSHGLTAAQRRAVADDLMDRLPRDEVSTKEAKALFGPRARVALDALWAKINAARARESGSVEVGDGRERSVSGLSDDGGSMKDDAGESIVPNLGAEDLEQITSSHLDKEAGKPEVAYHHYKPGGTDKTTGEIKPPEPYQQGGRVKNKDGSFTYHNAHAAKRTSDMQTVGASEVQRQGYMDYLREKHGGDFEAIARDFEALTDAKKDELLRLQNKTGRMETMADGSKQVVHDTLDKLVNKHFYVLRETAQRKMGEATNIDAKSLGREGAKGQIIGNEWAEKSDGEYGTTKHGRIWLERVNADGSTSEFATSTSRIIRRMTDARKAEGRVDESGGIAGQRTMLHQGLASLLTAEAEAEGKPVLTGRVGFKETADGAVQWQPAGQDFPDTLRMHSASGQTYKDAKSAVRRGQDQELSTWADDRRKKLLERTKSENISSAHWSGVMMDLQRLDQVLASKSRKALEQLRREHDYARDALRMEKDETPEVGESTVETKLARSTQTVSRDNQGNKFGSKKIALQSARESDRVVKRSGAWVIERDSNDAVRTNTDLPTELEGMGKTSNVRSRQEDNTSSDARNVDETTGQALHADERVKSDDAAKKTRAERTAFLVDGLAKSVPGFVASVRKISAERRDALLAHLKTLAEAGKGNPIWDGKPPADMDQFAARARVALVEMGAMKGAVKGPIPKKPAPKTVAAKTEVAKPSAPPAQKFGDVLKRMNDYLDNPPADYNVKQLEAIRDWATKQEARLNEAKSKYKEGQDDEWGRLDDLRFEATMLKANATEAIATEADADAWEKEQGGPTRHNKQDPKHKAFGTAQAATPEEQAKFHADILRRLGPQMKSGLLEVLMGKNARGKDIYLSGKWEKGAIYASVYAKNLDQIGAHEAFHEFFSRLRDEPAAADVLKVLDRAANSPYVVRQLERLLDGETEALKQIKQGAKHSAEERMAYMFQFHQAGLLKLGPETETVFQKIARFFRKVAGLINDDERADLLLRAFDRGEAQTADAAARVLANSVTARAQMYTRVNEASQPMLARASRLVNTAETNLERQGVEDYHTIRRLFKRSVGESGAQGYLDAKDHLMKQKSNELFKAFQDANGNDHAPADLALAAKYLHTGKKPTDPVVRDIVKKLTGPDGILPRMHKYLTDAGVMRWEADEARPGKGEWVPMGKIDAKYFPRVYDTATMVTKPDEFVADLVKYNAAELNAIAAEQNALLAKSDVKDATPVTAEGVARGITNRLINAFGSELDENSSAVGFSPVMQAVNKRSLHWLAPEVLEKWGEKDVAKIMTSYVAQGIKRAEYVRRFGNGGEKLQDMLKAAHDKVLDRMAEKEFGPNARGIYTTTKGEDKVDQRRVIEAALATAGKTDVKARLDALEMKALKIAKGAATDVMAMEGTLGYDIKPGMRRFQNSLLVYENMRLLSTSLFSQFIDPLGIVVRGGTMTDAWNSYKRGIREVIASIKGDPIKDLDAQIADQVGTTDANGFLAAFGQLYSSQYMGDKFRKANDVLFKYNGMEGFNRGMQVSATRAAINFIKRHATQPNDNSVDFLKELNLTAKDVVVDAKTGELDYTDPKIQQAIHQWVSGSIMRPNAAQRPAWGSDPHYMVFWHMKQFAYTFHDVIMKRAMFNYKTYGDMGPMGTLLMAYTPVMIVTDALKGVLLSGGEEPGWMRAGLGSELYHGVTRAGLAGKFQPGVDVMGPHRTVLGLGGPAIEQIVQMFEKSPVDSAINALPGANVWNTMKGGPMVEMQGED